MAKVMIVDDSETLRNSLLKLLTGAGLEVVEAADGAKGVALWGVHGQDVALIITDYNMPEMDGITMVKKIRAKKSNLRIHLTDFRKYLKE